MRYCLHERAGSSDKRFPNSPFPRDCDADGVLPSRRTPSGAGFSLADFCALPEAQTAMLDAAHVGALRIYSTAAFKALNSPLRAPWGNRAHPFPVTVTFLSEAVARLRAVGAASADANVELDLWRGMRDVTVSEDFLANGGTELAMMSTTRDLAVAVSYADASSASLLFKLRTTSFMGRGASLAFLSTFPGEDECLFPPLTYCKPTGKCEQVDCFSRSFTVVEVVPHFGTA